MAADGSGWRPAREDFLLPVRALSVLFRAKFRDALRQTELFEQVPAGAWTQNWVVHCQPVGDGARALKYLAPYIFRVAISNRRILSLEDDQVTFSYTDARSGQRKTCTVGFEEFIRRFLQHVLPKGFAKVRYYGFFGPNQREARCGQGAAVHLKRRRPESRAIKRLVQGMNSGTRAWSCLPTTPVRTSAVQ